MTEDVNPDLRPPSKPVRLRVTFELADWDDETVRFHFEENHCVHNLLQHALEREASNTCTLCSTAETKVIGL